MQVLIEDKEFQANLLRLKTYAIENVIDVVAFKDRLDEIIPCGDNPKHVVSNGTMRIVYSVEKQPIGLCHHLSVSKNNENLPHPVIVEHIMDKLGIADKMKSENVLKVWIEGNSVNVLAHLLNN